MKKPIKIILALALVAVLALSFTACSGSSDETTTTAPTTEAVSDTAQNDGEDGQNPVMNFIGNYDNGGTTILVEADAKDGAVFTVDEPMTDDEKYTYTFSGTLDLDTLKVTYSNSTKKVIKLDSQGNVTGEKTAYTDGAGVVIFHDDGTLEWQDENEAERFVGSNVFNYVLPE